MIKIPVIHLSYDNKIPSGLNRDYWDGGMVRDLLENKWWDTGYEFVHSERVDGDEVLIIPADIDGAIIVLPARNQTEYIDRLNEDIAQLKWVILMVMGDEENSFPVEQIRHNNIKIWVMSPRPGRHEKYDKLGTGYPHHMHKYIPKRAPDKPLDFFFAGQITHPRRELCRQALEFILKHVVANELKGEAYYSEGFTQGLTHSEYFSKMLSAKSGVAPSGPQTPDSFRIFELLEAGCVPVADTFTDKDDFQDDYWAFFFDEFPPFLILRDYDSLLHWFTYAKDNYPALNNKVFAWWQGKKRKAALKIRDQIHELSGIAPEVTVDNQITVLIPTSYAQLHPSTGDIEITIDTVRGHLPDSPIFIMIDSLRPELESKKEVYEEYQRQLIWLCTHKYHNVLPIRYEEFSHQSGMTKKTLPMVETPYILYVEHDTPLTPDRPIEWDKLIATISEGDANVIRLNHEALILPDHEHLMIGEPELVGSLKARMRKTFQWSGRPHLASTAFYRDMLDRYFSEHPQSFIEDRVYGFLNQAYETEGTMGWNLWRVFVYTPEGESILRSYHLDSRQGENKFDEIQKF